MSVSDIYIIENRKVAFTDYDELIRYVRRHALNEHTIYKTRSNSWNETEEAIDITQDVCVDAFHSNFDHWRDENYSYRDRESIRTLKLIGMKIYE